MQRCWMIRQKTASLACFAEVEQCRAYRNAIIHHHIYDHAKGIGTYVDESKSSYQILVSLDALATLYNILCSLLLEVREIDLLLVASRMWLEFPGAVSGTVKLPNQTATSTS